MPRPKGSKVIQCKCGSRVVGMPGKQAICSGCEKEYRIPTKAEAAAAKKASPVAVKKGAKKPAAKKKK